MSMENTTTRELCAPKDANGARAYTERDRFVGQKIQYGDHVSVDGHGKWRVIDIHPESGDIGLDTEDGIWYVIPSRVALVD